MADMEQTAEKFAEVMNEVWLMVPPVLDTLRPIVEFDIEIDPPAATLANLEASLRKRTIALCRIAGEVAALIAIDEAIAELKGRI